MRGQREAAENAEQNAERHIDDIRKLYEEPLMRKLTSGPNGLTIQEIEELVHDDVLMGHLIADAKKLLLGHHEDLRRLQS